MRVATSSAFSDHKELRTLLDAMIRSARLSFEKTSALLPFAMALSPEGRVSKLASTMRAQQTLEDGLSLLAKHGDCKALGFCSADRQGDDLHIFVEHRDGSAFRLRLPLDSDAFVKLQLSQLKPLRAEPKFFVRVNRNQLSASTNTRW